LPKGGGWVGGCEEGGISTRGPEKHIQGNTPSPPLSRDTAASKPIC
jgi:hypothetical protein